MEKKSSFESRNKRQLQSDVESKRKRHKGGSNRQKLDGDIRMETIIYKLDSRNKIVLPRADETNTDNEFLQYVKTRIEEKSLPVEPVANGRRNSKDKTKKHERTRKPRRYSYDSGTSIDEYTAKHARNSISGGHRGSRNGQYKHAGDYNGSEERMSHNYDKRPSNGYDENVGSCGCRRRNNSVADRDEEKMSYNYDRRPSNGYDRTVDFCSCTRGKNSVAVPKAMAYAREQNAAPVNDQYFCELSEEQMMQCFQLVFKKLCTLQNANGTRLEIDVAAPSKADSPEATSTTRPQRYTPPPQALPHPQPTPQPAPPPPERLHEPVETRVLGKQFDVNNGQFANVTDNQNQAENSSRQSHGGAEPINEAPEQNQQHAHQLTTPMEQHYEQQQQQQQYEQEPSKPLEAVERHSSLTFMERYPTEFDPDSMHFTHRIRSSTQSGVAGRESLGGNYVHSGLSQAVNGANTNYPIYPYGYKNGLQKLSATSVRIIPNVTVVDCNDNFCSIPLRSPNNNESYEYILMRVKKNRTVQCNCKR
ncbi:PREDICTED: uncharacterized protein LOC108965082 [Bactrocera latifrons]|uniref:uncharacterized protein LOC108965082 n=1 Tax=Bactrocera latifrons TaxID=174628 RepID=UPI0008DD3D0E|nr:PREDICTED: uncharacterized protein LOC108965082 [Bactrocera latifrons]